MRAPGADDPARRPRRVLRVGRAAARPDPRGRPIAVGGGVVLAASYEAKAFGVHAGMSGRRARQLCPGLTFVGRPLPGVPAARRRGDGRARRLHAAGRAHLDRRGVPRRDRLGAPVRAARARSPRRSAQGAARARPADLGRCGHAPSTSPRSRPRWPSPTVSSWWSRAGAGVPRSPAGRAALGRRTGDPARGSPSAASTRSASSHGRRRRCAAALLGQATARSWPPRRERRPAPDRDEPAGPVGRGAVGARRRASRRPRSCVPSARLPRRPGRRAAAGQAPGRPDRDGAGAVRRDAVGDPVAHPARAGLDDAHADRGGRAAGLRRRSGTRTRRSRSAAGDLGLQPRPVEHAPARAAGAGDDPRRPGPPPGRPAGPWTARSDAVRDRFGREAVGYAAVALSAPGGVPDEFRELAEHD